MSFIVQNYLGMCPVAVLPPMNSSPGTKRIKNSSTIKNFNMMLIADGRWGNRSLWIAIFHDTQHCKDNIYPKSNHSPGSTIHSKSH